MDILIKVLQFILSFSLLVIIHEFGHFIFARIFKTRVEKFYLFFNPWFSLVKFKFGETEYGIGWIPFGGYVKIAGMIDESMDTEQLKQPVQPYEFRAKPAWQRLLIMTGGVLMNVILAFCIYIGMSYKWGDSYVASKDVKYGYVFNEAAQQMGFRDGDIILNVGGQYIEESNKVPQAILLEQAQYVTVERDGTPVRIAITEEDLGQLIKHPDFMSIRLPFVIGDVIKDGGAAAAGLQTGDKLMGLNGEPMKFFDQYQKALAAHKGQTVSLELLRDSAGTHSVRTVPVEVSEAGLIGVGLLPWDQLIPVSTKKYTFAQAIPAGFKRTGTELSNYWKQLKLIFKPKTEAYKSLGGMITIGSIFPNYWSWQAFWHITAFLSIILAVMNILPIPLLDGGHVLFLLVEVITRRKPSEKFLIYAQNVGLIIVGALLIFANGNDIYRFFIK